jgi:hypothetical protein
MQKMHITTGLLLDFAEGLDHRELESGFQCVHKEVNDRYFSVNNTLNDSVFIIKIENQWLGSIIFDRFDLLFGSDQSVEFLVWGKLGSAQLSEERTSKITGATRDQDGMRHEWRWILDFVGYLILGTMPFISMLKDILPMQALPPDQ